MRKKLLWVLGLCLALAGVSISIYVYRTEIQKKQTAVNELLNYYYRNPQPDRLIPVLETTLGQKRFIESEKDFGPFVHFYATILQHNQDKLNEIKEIEKKYFGKQREAIQKIIAESENYRATDPGSPEALELIWAEYKATGEERIIERIINAIDTGETTTENQFSKEAKAFLIKKIPWYSEVYDYLWYESIRSQTKTSIAIDEILHAVKITYIDPANMHRDRGGNLSNLRNHTGAIREYQKALSYFPDNSMIYNNLSNTYEQMGKMEQALNLVKKSVEMNPENALACYNLGRHYDRLKRYDDAIKFYLKALDSYPQSPRYNHAIGRSYQKKGDTEKAVFYFRKYLEYAPNGENVRFVRQYLASLGKPVPIDPTDTLVMFQRKQYEALEKHFTSLLSKREKDKEGASLLYRAYEKLCMNPDAQYSFDTWIESFNDWLRHNPNSHFANACIGTFYIDYAWNARGSGWGNTVSRKGIGLFEERLSMARDRLEKAYKSDPTDPIVPAMLILVARGLGLKYEEMERQFQNGVKADSSEFEVYNQKFVYLMPKWHGTEEQVFQFVRNAAKSAPADSLIPKVLADAHWEVSYGRNNRASYFKNPEVWTEIRDVYLELSRRFPNSREIHNRFALAAYFAGDMTTVRGELEVIKNDWLEETWGNKKFFEFVKKQVRETGVSP